MTPVFASLFFVQGSLRTKLRMEVVLIGALKNSMTYQFFTTSHLGKLHDPKIQLGPS